MHSDLLLNLYNLFLEQNQQIQTDTRKIKPGDIFFALKGANFDGNNFATQALAMGAKAVVIDNDKIPTDDRYYVVNDVLETLQSLARHHRLQSKAKIIAITGSNGKTTTKELLHSVLQTQYKTIATIGNLNNHIGVPLSLLRIQKDTEIAIIEMGANHIGEIAAYCEWAIPDFGIITNVGKAHLEGFGSVEGIKQGKGELYKSIINQNGTIFQWGDTDYLGTMSGIYKNVVTYGIKMENDIVATVIDKPMLTFNIEKPENISGVFTTQLVGNYNLPNALCAVTVGHYFQIDKEKIEKAISGYMPDNSRSQLIKTGNNHIILDAYNANPTSMHEAILNFRKIDATHKVLFLGCMKELGEDTKAEHESIVKLLKESDLKNVYLVGEEYEGINQDFALFSNSESLANYLESAPRIEDAYILIKGSRGAKMELVLPSITR